jgi:hypothetical protein
LGIENVLQNGVVTTEKAGGCKVEKQNSKMTLYKKNKKGGGKVEGDAMIITHWVGGIG